MMQACAILSFAQYSSRISFCMASPFLTFLPALFMNLLQIWKTVWTPVKVAYLFCRYWVLAVGAYLLYCFVAEHTKETCDRIFRIPVALAMWNQVGSESILLIRTYAFFNRSIYVLVFLLCALAGVVAYQLYVDTTHMWLLPFVKPPFTHGPCLPMSKPHSAHLLGDLFTFMTIFKAFRIRRRSGGPNSKLIQTFLKEGVFYYLLISVSNLINGIFYLQPRQVLSAINIPLSVMMAPLLACRLILDLRQRGSETVTHSEGTGMAAFSAKSGSNTGSPFTPPMSRKHKMASSRYRNGPDSTLNSSKDVALESLGTNHELDLEMDMNSAVELDAMDHRGVDLGTLSTAVGGEEHDALSSDRKANISDLEYGHSGLELGFRSAPSLDNIRRDIRGIRVNVEKSTTTM
ncbi:hypothetical protein DL96DRAFT_1574545 [Flagelloscypha sp. PMI_526]|nr:hypothetical protein DL96DRAFT_1574545 [Flagelloscypha sp. PMI_526]